LLGYQGLSFDAAAKTRHVNEECHRAAPKTSGGSENRVIGNLPETGISWCLRAHSSGLKTTCEEDGTLAASNETKASISSTKMKEGSFLRGKGAA